MDIKFKICRKCGDPKKLDEFPDSSNSPDGKGSWCKECKAEVESERRRKAGAEERRKRDPALLAQGKKECFGPCGKVLPLADFTPSPDGWGGRAAYCRNCTRIMNAGKSRAAYMREYRKKHK